MIVIEGMGVTGSLFARLFELHKIPFRWYDSEEKIVSWPATTGCIYPCNDAGAEDYRTWHNWARDYFRFEPWFEQGDYWYNHIHPPHNVKSPPDKIDGLLKRSPLPSYHINSQELVRTTRERFKDLRLSSNSKNLTDVTLVAHGFNERMTYAYWGWSCLVDLRHRLSGNGRPCLTLYDKVQFRATTYAYPCPGTSYFYAGSSFIKQKLDRLRPLETSLKFENWSERFENLTDGKILVKTVEGPKEGWRPANGAEDTNVIQVNANLFLCPPLAGNGIRRFPSVFQSWTSYQ
jgi:hypothetical protein